MQIELGQMKNPEEEMKSSLEQWRPFRLLWALLGLTVLLLSTLAYAGV